jgi:tRNA(Ile)-lysidine synthase
VGPQPEVAAVRRAVRACLSDLAPGALVVVACSGGADSVALASALAFEAPRAGLRAGGLTVDHGMQAGSADRAAKVAAEMSALGLAPVEVLTVVVAPAGGPEAAARRARYRALDEAAGRLGAVTVLLGHTRDDQAETVLLGLARGSGARSLAGMPASRGRYRRPLLDLPRAVVRAAAAGHPTWDDPHNADQAFTRARVRHTALPSLERELGPGVAAALARTARQLRRDADALDAWADRALQDCRVARSGGPPTPGNSQSAPLEESADGVALVVEALAGLPAAVRTRVLRRAALAAGCPATDLTADHVDEIDRLLTAWHGQGPLHLPAGVRAWRACGTLTLSDHPRHS